MVHSYPFKDITTFKTNECLYNAFDSLENINFESGELTNDQQKKLSLKLSAMVISTFCIPYKEDNFSKMSHGQQDKFINNIIDRCDNIIELNYDEAKFLIDDYLEKPCFNKHDKETKDDFIRIFEKNDVYINSKGNTMLKIYRDLINTREKDLGENDSFMIKRALKSFCTFREFKRLLKNIPLLTFRYKVNNLEMIFDLSEFEGNQNITCILLNDTEKDYQYYRYHFETSSPEYSLLISCKNNQFEKFIESEVILTVILSLFDKILNSKRKVIVKEKKEIINEVPKNKYKTAKTSLKRSNIYRYISFSNDNASDEDIKARRRLFTKYFKESWNRRGHIRTYKNGRTVFVKATSCKRSEDLLKKNMISINEDGTTIYTM